MVTLNNLRAADYAVLATSGAIVLVALLAAAYTLYYRLARKYEPYNELWAGRVLLELIFGLWGAVQILHLALFWGPNSIVALSSVTNWTSAGWLCRIYLTSALGVLAPFAAWFPFFLLAAGTKKTTADKILVQAYQDAVAYDDIRMVPSPSKRVGRALLYATLCVLPVALLQAAVAWVSYWVKYHGQSIEAQPRTLIGYFLAVFWGGTAQQCSTSTSAAVVRTSHSSDVYQPPVPCTLCTFPASAAIIHLLWTAVFLLSLWRLYDRLVSAALNRVLKKRIRTTVAILTGIAAVGCACIGASVVTGPFNWVNQGCWLGYVATIAATVVLLTWKVVVFPVYTSHTAAKRTRATDWRDPADRTLAQAVVAAPEPPPPYYPYTYPYPLGTGNDADGNATYCHLQLTPMGSSQWPSTQKMQSRMLRAPTPAQLAGVYQTPMRSHMPDPFDQEESISARDVLLDTTAEGGTPQNLLRLYGRSESPSGSTVSLPYLNYNQYHRQQYHSGIGTGSGLVTPKPQPRPNSASSSAAGSVYSVGGVGPPTGGAGLATPASLTGRAGSSWPLPSPASVNQGVSATGSARGHHLALNYPMHSQLQPTLSQRLQSLSSYSRPSTGSSTAAPTGTPTSQMYSGYFAPGPSNVGMAQRGSGGIGMGLGLSGLGQFGRP